MKILLASPEIHPLAKTGGLADTVSSLADNLERNNNDVVLTMPYYRTVMPDINLKIEKTEITFGVPVGDSVEVCEVFKCKLPGTDVQVFLLGNDKFFNRAQLYMENGVGYPDNDERFIFFSRAVIEFIISSKISVDIIHTFDWQTGLVHAYKKTLYANNPIISKPKTIFTVHNLAYQGLFPVETMSKTGLNWDHYNSGSLEFWGHVNFIKGGIVFADKITTVSPTYAKEIQTEEFGNGLDGLLAYRHNDIQGILTGADYNTWDPKIDKLICKNYSKSSLQNKTICKLELQKKLGLQQNPDVALISMISRMTEQKGFDLVINSFDYFESKNMQLVVLGKGDPHYEELLKEMERKDPSKFNISIKFNEALAHEIEAGADVLLMPSRFEPSGMNQIYSLAYGTVPIVRNIGGLADTIVDVNDETLANKTATGFKFQGFTASEMQITIDKTLDIYYNSKPLWKEIQQNGMNMDFSWDKSAKEYIKLYKET